MTEAELFEAMSPRSRWPTRRELMRIYKARSWRELERRYYRAAWARQALFFWMEWPIPRPPEKPENAS